MIKNKDDTDLKKYSQDEYAVVSCGTTKGPITIEFYRYWSPNGYDKVIQLYEIGYYDRSHFFRMVPNFLVQFGITYNNDRKIKQFGLQTILDDPQLNPPIPFLPGTLSFAGGGPNSRTSQLFIAFGPGSFGTEKWETPIGRVTSGMEHVYSFYSEYGDMPPWGNGPVQHKIHNGPEYIETNFPEIDRFETCQVQRKQPSSKKIKNGDDENDTKIVTTANKDTGHDDNKKNISNKQMTKQQQRELLSRKPKDDVKKKRRKNNHSNDTDTKATLRKTNHHHEVHQQEHHPHNFQNRSTRLHPGLQYHHHVHEQQIHQQQLQHQHQQHEIHPGHASRNITKIKEVGPIEEGVTKLSWELLSVCLSLFFVVLMCWLKFVLQTSNGPRKSRKTH